MYKSWRTKFDFFIVIIVILLTLYGLIIIYSANNQDTSRDSEFFRQLIYFAAGIIMLIIFAAIDYKFLAGIELYLYLLNLAALAAVLVAGKEALGAQRWIAVGSFTFQPSEFAKIFFILSLAVRLSDEKALTLEKMSVTFLYLAVPIFLIMKQPDLGTALVLAAIFFIMLFVRGLNPLFIAGFIASGLAAAPFLLKDYQRKRLMVFINPDLDPTGAGWNLRQSIIGVGSGKIRGKGLYFGTQTHLKFVPEHSRDFIFTVLSEELGFLGAVSLILVYFVFLWRCVHIAKNAKDLLGTLIAAGITAMFFFHVFVNIGMTIGLMPVTGLPLPFLSYGGSALMANFCAVGILSGIAMRNEQFFK